MSGRGFMYGTGRAGNPPVRTDECLVVYCAHGLADPLVAPLVLDYILRIQHADASEGGPRPTLFFTEEPPGAAVPEALSAKMTDAGIRWIPLGYDVHGRQWVQKLRIVRRLFTETRSFVRPFAKRWLIGYLSYGGSYAILAQLLGLGRAITVCFEPHSMYMVEQGIWGRSSIKTLFMRWLENLQLRRGHALVIPTIAGVELARRSGTKAIVRRMGITIDVDAARFDEQARMRIRKELGLKEGTVLVYVGKFGGIYLTVEEYLRFVIAVAPIDPALRFLIITSARSLEELRRHPLFSSVEDRIVLQPPVPADELHQFLSAGDIGVVAIPPTPSQVYRTPVKSAHYWAAGLPIMVPAGVSDDHRIAVVEDAGIVVDDLRTVQPAGLKEAIDRYMELDPEVRRDRCIKVAMKYRDTGMMVSLLRDLLTGRSDGA